MSKTLKAQLKNLKQTHDRMKPSRDFVVSTRKRVVSFAAQTAPSKKSLFGLNVLSEIFFPPAARAFARPVIMVTLVMGVSIAGWAASASATYKSLPGDIFYNVKIATEKTQIAIVGAMKGPQEKAKLFAKAAQNRADEAKELIVQNRTEDVADTLDSLKASVTDAAKSVQQVSVDSPKDTADVASVVSEVQHQISATLNLAIASTAPTDAGTVVVAQVVSAAQTVADQSVAVVSTVVETQKNGGLDAAPAGQVQDVVKTALDHVATGIAETTASVQQALAVPSLSTTTPAVVVSVPSAVSTTVPAIVVVPVATSSTVISSSTTVPAIVAPAVPTAPAIPVAVIDLTAVKAEANKNFEQVKTLVDEGRFSEAVEKSKSATVTSNTAVNIAVQAGNVVAVPVQATTTVK